jgi:hypothetical protein
MQAEDVSEQLTTIETILKLAKQEKKLLNWPKAEKLNFRLHAAEQLRLVLLEKRNYRNGA